MTQCDAASCVELCRFNFALALVAMYSNARRIDSGDLCADCYRIHTDFTLELLCVTARVSHFASLTQCNA